MSRRGLNHGAAQAHVRSSRGTKGIQGGSADSATDPAVTFPASLGQAAHLAAIGSTTNTTAATAIAGSYADLAAARTSVNALRTDGETARAIIETRLDNVEAKIDATLSALQTAGLMA